MGMSIFQRLINIYNNFKTKTITMVYIVDDEKFTKFGKRILVKDKNYFMSEELYYTDFERLARMNDVSYDVKYISFKKFLKMFGEKDSRDIN